MNTSAQPTSTSATVGDARADAVTDLVDELASALRRGMPELSEEDLGHVLVELGVFAAEACVLDDQKARGIAEHITKAGRELLHARQAPS